MFFSYSAAFLFVFGIVTSLATVDLDSPEPNLLLPDSSVEDALNSHIPLTPAADVTAWNDVLASGTADGTTDGAGIFDPDNDPIINSADTECMTDTINGRRRVRRSSDWCTVPVPVPPDTKNNPLRKPQSGSDTNKSPVLRDPTRNSAGQNAGKQNQNQDTPQISSPSPEINLPVYTPSLDYKEPLEDATMCDTARYGDSNIPMCDAGFIMNIVGIPRKMGVMYRFQNGRQYARLMKAHPCTYVFKLHFPYLNRRRLHFMGASGRHFCFWHF